MSVGQCIALLEAEVEWKLTSTLIIFLARPRFESLLTRPSCELSVGCPSGSDRGS